ncbi:MAG: hydroxyacid dehydrogenase [Armatimonadetes bacterium]|nr:hydroxyacid dehydrogenase [Armatimonadota bacterium]
MYKILLPEPIHEEGLKLLRQVGEVHVSKDAREDVLCREVADADAILVRSSPIIARVIEAAPKLKVISRHGIGTDNIDLKAATERGVLVLNTPDANVNAVAEHTVALMLALAKRLFQMDRQFREGKYYQQGSLPGIVSRLEGAPAFELAGKRLGLVGAGKIARRTAEICLRAFAMKVSAYDPYVPPGVFQEAGLDGIELQDSLETVLSTADFISLHVPLTPETRGLIGRREIGLMKPGVCLINTARGGVVDEDALEEALRTGRIAGAALDVFGEEPPDPARTLFSCPNLIVTPHMAALTEQALIRMAVESAAGIVDFFRGRRPKNVVNPDVLSREN